MDLKEHIGVLKRHFSLILSFAGIAIALILLTTFRAPGLYQSEAILRIKQSTNIGVSLLRTDRNGDPLVMNQRLSTYIEIMRSRTVIEKVMDRIKWESFQRKKRKTKRPFEKPDFKAVKRLFIIVPVKNTDLLKIMVRSPQPQQAEVMVNTLIDVFIGRIIEITHAEQKAVRKFIEVRLNYSKKRMENAENRIVTFKSENKIFKPTIELKEYVNRISGLDLKVAKNDLDLAIAKARLVNAGRQIDRLKPGYIAENAIIEFYKRQLADLEIKLIGLTYRYGEKHPEITTCRMQIAETKEKLDMEIKRISIMDTASSNRLYQNLFEEKLHAETAIAIAALKQAALDNVLNQEERTLSNFSVKEQELIRLMRDAAIAQAIWIMLTERLEEARIAEVMQPTDVQIIDKAVISREPIKVKRTRRNIFLIGMCLIIGLGLTYILDYFNKYILTDEDVKYYLDLPVLGRIPEEHHDRIDYWSKFKKETLQLLRRLRI